MQFPLIGNVPVPRLFDLPEELSLMLIGEIFFLAFWILLRALSPKIFRPEKELFAEALAARIPRREVFFAALWDGVGAGLLASATYSAFLTFMVYFVATQPPSAPLLWLDAFLAAATLFLVYLAYRRGQKRLYEYLRDEADNHYKPPVETRYTEWP